MSVQYFEGVGRRKESIARVRLMSGSGQFTVNEKELQAYFTRLGDIETILAPLKAAGQDLASFDIS
ncbi:MAG: 30S ribosomal protein S9, partial [Anaerolineales bacterium]|nr:30S ribosomal protein S9 [Anaerolineales bacterium]